MACVTGPLVPLWSSTSIIFASSGFAVIKTFYFASLKLRINKLERLNPAGQVMDSLVKEILLKGKDQYS